MHLQAWMTVMGLRNEDLRRMFAEHGAPVHESLISRWRLGRIRPSWERIKVLRQISNGAVRADDWIELTPEVRHGA